MNFAKELYEWCENKKLPCFFNEEIASTNDLAKNQAFDSDEKLRIFVTDFQTKGRGRGDNQWVSPPKGSALLNSWVYSLDGPPQAITGPLVGLALYRSFSSVWPKLEFSVKAPNDLLLKGKKFAGLLIESLQQAQKYYVVIGFGINFSDAPKEFDFATFLNSNLGLSGNLSQETLHSFFDSLHNELEAILSHIKNSEITNVMADELKAALNYNPHLAAPFDEVCADGSLIVDGNKINWKDL